MSDLLPEADRLRGVIAMYVEDLARAERKWAEAQAEVERWAQVGRVASRVREQVTRERDEARAMLRECRQYVECHTDEVQSAVTLLARLDAALGGER